MDHSKKKEIENIWSIALEIISQSFSPTTFNLWFADTEALDITENKFVISSPSAFKRDIIMTKHRDVVEGALAEVLGYDIELAILSADDAEAYISHGVIPAQRTAQKPQEQKNIIVTPVNEYTFDNFIVGSSNKFAHAAAIAVAKSPAVAYNPLYIWGPPGIGKTHLMYAIKNDLTANEPGLKTIYVKGEDFLIEVVDAIMMHTTHILREKYRTVDVLFIDDIQLIAGKPSTQEEFFHTFDSLFVENKQIIITSDRPPKELKTLTERLISRFESGLIADIQSPDIELRMAIIKNKAAKMGIEIPNDVVTYLADRLKNNVRQIEGSLKKLSALSLLSGTPITLEVAKGAVSDISNDREPADVTVEKIFSAVAQKYRIPVGEIKSRKRTDSIANARHICIYLLRTLTDLTLNQIGMLFSRDHTTAMSSLRKIESRISNDAAFEAEMNELISDIKET